MKATPITVIALLLTLLCAAPAHAYLDPGTGSMILQVILGGVAAATVAMKLYWQRIKGFFGGSSPEESEPLSRDSSD
ncbi:MAG: hypothetical protein V2I57_07810 [Xanthomonadales bacterium]|jgi:hypothetical protein|nr:hypothetical protein [Xanthomonadales bacterium]